MTESGFSSFGPPRFFFSSPRRLFTTNAENHAGNCPAEFSLQHGRPVRQRSEFCFSAMRLSRFSRLVDPRLGRDDIKPPRASAQTYRRLLRWIASANVYGRPTGPHPAGYHFLDRLNKFLGFMINVSSRFFRVGVSRFFFLDPSTPPTTSFRSLSRTTFARAWAKSATIEATARQAASGVPSMVALFAQLRAKVSPTRNEQKGGLLVVPAVASMQEFIEEEEARNANAKEPGTYVNHKAEEFIKAVQGIGSPLGEALLASHRRWR